MRLKRAPYGEDGSAQAEKMATVVSDDGRFVPQVAQATR